MTALFLRLLEGPPMPPEDADFSFSIDFTKGRGDPRRVFDAASLFIDGLEALDDAVAGSVGGKIKTVMVLEDVEKGSLKAYLRTLLQNVDDEALKDLEWRKAVGAALVKAKYVALEYLDEDKDGAAGRVDSLREDLRLIAQQTDVRHLPDYAPIHEGRLVAALDRIQDAKRTLSPGDALIIEGGGKRYEVDLTKTWDPSEVITVLPITETHSEGEIILTIRKPDLLGNSMWQFSFAKTPISARILDEDWLRDFHDRKIPLYSGDALRCRVRFTYLYDEAGTLIEQKIEVLKVLGPIRGAGAQQSFLG
jgi:hypothetical protein